MLRTFIVAGAILSIVALAASGGMPAADAQTYVQTIGNGQVTQPSAIAVDTVNGNNILVTNEDQIDVFSASGTYLRSIGGAGSGNGQFYAPDGIAIDTANGANVVVVDSGNNRIEVFGADGTFIRTFGSMGSGPGQLQTPTAVAVDTAHGSNIVVNDSGNSRIEIFSATGEYIASISQQAGGNGELAGPWGSLAVDPANDGNILVIDDGATRIQVFTASGSFIRSIGEAGQTLNSGDLWQPNGLAIDPAHGSRVLVGDQELDAVKVFSATGEYLGTITGGTTQNWIGGVQAVAVDGTADGNVVIGGNGIQVFTDSFYANDSPIAAAVVPGGRVVGSTATATVFATMANAGATPLEGCQVSLPYDVGLTLDYQTTSAMTNAPTGSPDTPVTIAGGGYQTFLLSFQSPKGFLDAQVLPLVFGCQGVPQAAVVPGLDTVDLNFGYGIADMIVLAATPSGNGVLALPYSQGESGAFAVASFNAGSYDDAVVVTADTGRALLPLQLSLCQTVATTGQCMVAPSSSVVLPVNPNDTPTFSVFATATGTIPFDPENSRIFIRFTAQDDGIDHGSSSVAVQTQ